MVSFEVHTRVDDGIPVLTTRALTKNCNTMYIGDYRFDGRGEDYNQNLDVFDRVFEADATTLRLGRTHPSTLMI